ncbi:MAG TPA: sigma-70 family RNA polymerase sigma factor [Acidimicrobiales bacterium]|nr:sigma-70 family RNA polymerase sigma factor [Acidimicrobiales bacterium]
MTLTALSDASLLDQARSGDEAAFTELYVRHQAAALRLASTYRRLGDPDDLVNGAFERVLGAIRRGAGPTESFRAYLFVTLRRLAAEDGERPADQALDDVPEPVSHEAGAAEMGQADREIVTQAFESLPERWQAVLWHTAVEGRQPKELAGVLGVSANAAAAMAYRAREKLRQSYLQAHLLAVPAPEHEPHRSRLGAYVRDGLSKRDHAAVHAHLRECESCTALVAELEDVNRVLARAVLPLFLLAGAKLGGGAAAAAAAGGAATGTGGGGHPGIVGKLRHLAPTIGSAAAITIVVAGLAGLGTVVAREDASIDRAADAADLGVRRTADDERSDRRDRDGGDDAGDSLFGEDDFAVVPLDDDAGLFGMFDGFDEPSSRFVPRSRGGSPTVPRATRPRPTTPVAPGAGPASPPATTPGPVVPPLVPPPAGPGPDPGPIPTPAPLAFTSAGWTPTAVGRGDLTLAIAEAGAGAAESATPLSLRVELTPGARLHPEAEADSRCAVDGQVIVCAFDQPPAGGTVGFALDLQVDGPGETATVMLFRGATLEASVADVLLSSLLTEPLWEPFLDVGQALSIGRLTAGATNAGTLTHAGAAVRMVASDDTGLLVPDLFTATRTVDGLLDQLPLSPAEEERLRPLLPPSLPPGCAVEGWTPPDAGATWQDVLAGGLPTTLVCQLGTLGPGAAPSIPGIVTFSGPPYGDGDGQQEDGFVTVTLELGGTPVATRPVPVG